MTTQVSHAAAVRDAFANAVARLDMDQVIPAASALAERLRGSDGLLYVLGSGHSQLLALEGYDRAGSPSWVAPLLDERLSPARGAHGTEAERTEGIGRELIACLDPSRARALLIISSSGRNTVPLEAAKASRSAGLLIIAITGTRENRLADLVDHALVTGVPSGDAAVRVGDATMAPLSTVVGAVLLHALFAETEFRLGAASVLTSVNVEGGQAHNQTLIQRYPHLRP